MSSLDPHSNPEVVTFYYNPFSRGRTVHWMLEELVERGDCKYEIRQLDFKTAQHKTPEYLKINPMGKIPAIIHRGTVITEVPAILTYLADVFPKAQMAPAVDDPKRGTYYRWMFFAAANLEPAFTAKKFPPKEGPPASHLGYGSYEQVVTTLEKAVENGYVTGKFSAADLFLAANIGWAISMKDLEAKPAFTNYLKLCTDRPSWASFTKQAPL